MICRTDDVHVIVPEHVQRIAKFVVGRADLEAEVIHAHSSTRGQRRRIGADFDEEQEKRAVTALEAIVAKIAMPKERLSFAVVSGGVYHELLREATEWRADLIVVGSHRPVMSDYLLGSNAKTIVRHAQCSVLVVRE